MPRREKQMEDKPMVGRVETDGAENSTGKRMAVR